MTLQYKPPTILFNQHLETIYPALLRRVELPAYERERIFTSDGDFLDLDWINRSSHHLVIISHGLEGNSARAYVKGMARIAVENGLDVLAWNYRGCSGEMNRTLRFYHSGATDDLNTVITHAVSTQRYQKISLIGFSLGGNLTLKYLGENQLIPWQVHKSVTFSVPMDLESSCEKISLRANWIYSYRFLRGLKSKVVAKSRMMNSLDKTGIDRLSTLKEFDDRYTAPLHGFVNAHDYYSQCSSIKFVQNIRIPTLIINAKNDPFLSDKCFPTKLLEDHSHVQLHVPLRGGHVGFTLFNKNGVYWSEQRAIEFILT